MKSGAPIPFIKFDRLIGDEIMQKLNPDNKKDEVPLAKDKEPVEIAVSSTISDHILNAKDTNRLVYCRYGDKYLADMEKRKNSNISQVNQPK